MNNLRLEKDKKQWKITIKDIRNLFDLKEKTKRKKIDYTAIKDIRLEKQHEVIKAE